MSAALPARELLGQLQDQLDTSGFRGPDLERFLVRLVFCLLADDTGVFDPGGLFEALIRSRTREDGTDTGYWVGEVFRVLGTREESREPTLDQDLARFPCIRGELFAGALRLPRFDADMRRVLLSACALDFRSVSPSIFGALLQSVMNEKQRRTLGAHYTAEKNILKVIEPLFLEELRAELAELCAHRDGQLRERLEEFRDKLASLRFLDPACGCGDFLVVSYRELRRLEIEALREIQAAGGKRSGEHVRLAEVSVHQFHGIEVDELSALVAEIALGMMGHLMTREQQRALGHPHARITLQDASRQIEHADALDVDWNDVLPARDCTFVFGNPPFGGAKYQTPEQRRRVQRLAQLDKNGGTLDLVSAWFLAAGAYVGHGRAKIAFVATSSITQGEQVAQLWPLLFQRHRLEIAFAHRAFEWGSDARRRAQVHVVVIGLTRAGAEPASKRLFSYADAGGDPVETTHGALTPYLTDAFALEDRHLVVRESSCSMSGAPPLVSGTQPIDDGNYIFDERERDAFLAIEPGAARLLRPYVGSEDYLKGRERWILALNTATPAELRALPEVTKRMARVRAFRAQSTRRSTRAIADHPARYNVEVIPARPFLAIPKVSSERREYVPIGWLDPPAIPSDLVFILENADHWHFGVLTSRMHMAWLRSVGGRLKSDLRYSIGVVYNPFPWPPAKPAEMDRIRALASAVLKERARHEGATLARLYDPAAMVAGLRKAHRDLDLAVDELYRKPAFTSDRERVEHLLGMYEKSVTRLAATARGRRALPCSERAPSRARPGR